MESFKLDNRASILPSYHFGMIDAGAGDMLGINVTFGGKVATVALRFLNRISNETDAAMPTTSMAATTTALRQH